MKNTWASAFSFIIFLVFAAYAFSAPVPDTGVTKCYNDTAEIACPSSGQSFYGQDANYSINPMSFTKLDGSGNALPDSATSWVMVKDNVTGLVWEMKNSKDGKTDYSNPHDADNTYTWYDSNPATNGGNAGIPGTGTDTEEFIKALNDALYGGYSDWRMPTIKELTYIVNYSILSPGPTIDIGYFQNTAASWYWSSTTYATDTHNAWFVDFGYSYGYGYYKGYAGYVRAVRGGQSGTLGDSVIGSLDAVDSRLSDSVSTATGGYTDNGDGTVTDTSTSLTWQKASSSGKNWEQALAYCEGLSLGVYTDWRLPTVKELQSLADYSPNYPAINITYFPDTAARWYWSSTTYVDNTNDAWVVNFDDGNVYSCYSKYHSGYVRAVRGGQSGSLDHSVLSVSPATQNVAKDAGTTTFSVSNTGTGTMPWTAAVTSGDGWLSITSGTSGTDTGTIYCSFTENTSTSPRTATIRITATGATGSPVDVTVTQSPTPLVMGPPTPPPTACTATLDGNLSLRIPYLSYYHPLLGTQTYWADFVYEFNPSYPALIPLKLTKYGIRNNPSFSCAASTLSDNFKIHIPNVLLPDGVTRLWLDLEYSPALSTDGNLYWVVSNYGAAMN